MKKVTDASDPRPRADVAHARRGALAAGAAALALGSLLFAVAHAQKTPPQPAPPATGGPAISGKPGPEDAGAPASAPVRAPTVKVVFKVVPPNNATVHWGNKRLGIIKPHVPLVIERPRDSGPLDVVVKSQGYVTVHTRAYTFTDTTVAVKLTPLDKKNTIYGYREEVPPDADGGAPGTGPGGVPDAGAPP